mmetsp:Transcript_98768/g.175849  ORF Transcript_98768/g.175849 Transcript_98768/m.175849 type:complete len:573 (-) Transcript_98768:155-1873(-)|eukprot:CAMPEP_0197660708 /NCGR_PEP_ID=MMETSP1338-20131121/51015_1 /TAXON_ID=43686 ORGANISM="Pelagodinium beii, Strain RCC1491" /NCGR_SAMPLE_ID=MMETSP1338 /ASSEMBLY_ACC=CAM_ASM_000754 /LENGTH=572 /DNA_ID=CAMNT_0043238125 /DNA_START=92 /DNA_END=1810 /DNA_ORIENTATION=-
MAAGTTTPKKWDWKRESGGWNRKNDLKGKPPSYNKATSDFASGRQSRQLSGVVVEQDVRARLEENAPTEECKARLQRCLTSLQEIVKDLGPSWRISPFGSAANGFCTKESDLDATCHEVTDEDEEEEDNSQKQPASGILGEKLAPLLKEHPAFTIAEEVLNARVPILKMCFEGTLEVDLSCHNTFPLHNTKLLEAYASLDGRVRDLGLAVKLWAKANRVCGAQGSHLSSYSIILMVIYFLQAHPKVRLPMLPVQAFKEASEDAEQKVEAVRSSWKCSFTLGQLLHKFFEFYCQDFYWGTEVVSIRLGSRLDASQPFFNRLKAKQYNRLHVEDPVDTTRNLNCVLGEMQEMQLRNAFEDTFRRLQQGKPMNFGSEPAETVEAEEEVLPPGPVARPEEELNSPDDADAKARSLSTASTASHGSGESVSSAENEDTAESSGEDGHVRKTCGEVEAALMATMVAKGFVGSPEPVEQKHALLQLLHGADQSIEQTPKVESNHLLKLLQRGPEQKAEKQSESQGLLQLLQGDQRDEQMKLMHQKISSTSWITKRHSKATCRIAAKVATVCTSRPAAWQ